MQHTLTETTADLLVVDVLGARGGRIQVTNVYSAPPGNSLRPGEGVRALSTASLQGRRVPTIVAGDFNSYHKSWSTTSTSSKRSTSGIKLASWAKAGDWELGLETGTVTRRGALREQDSAIDLVFLSQAVTGSGWRAECSARVDLATGSDHYPVVTVLTPPQPFDFQQSKRPLNFKRTDWDRFAEVVRRQQGDLDEVTAALSSTTTEEAAQRALDEAFGTLQALLTRCLEQTTPRCKGSNEGCRFWDVECDKQLEAMRVAELELAQVRADGVREHPARERSQQAAASFERQLKKSKKAFFDERIDALSGNSIFAAMKWSSGGKRRDQSPPLIGEDGIARVKGGDKMRLLREVLLAPPDPTRKQLPDLHQRTTNTLPDAALRKEELRAAVFGQAQDKAAGPDEIPFRALRAAWPILEERLFIFFAEALKVGWHPRPFRRATLVVLPKAGKRDLSKPRSYRLIALLPTLGKVLEKVVAARLAELGSRHGWIAAEQFGSVPGRSTSDAALTMVHDVEAGWTHAKPLITSALTFDVRGAYDSVHFILLICHLYEQGVPLHLLRWILSFLLERQASMRLDGEEGEMDEVNAGIPQGSPVSPILFILFAAPLHRLFGPTAEDPELRMVRHISYVDDNLIYVTSGSAARNGRILRKAYDAAFRWAKEWGLRYDAEKKDFIEYVAPRFTVAVMGRIVLRDGTVEAVEKASSFRWLGIEFDPQLKFTQHVEKVAASAKRAAGGMAMLMNTQKGMKVSDSRRLYIACILSRLVYAAEVWWRGMERVEPGRPHTRRRKEADGRRRIPPPDADQTKKNPEAAAHARKLDSAQHAALLRALPAYRTTSKVALQVEASCPPMDLTLDHCLERAALRIARMDHHHPLRARVSIESAKANAILPSATASRAAPPPIAFDSSRAAVSRPFSTRLTALALRVPRGIEPAASSMQTGSAGSLGSHSQAYIEGRADWKLPQAGKGLGAGGGDNSIEVYTDGSQIDEGGRLTGAGWVIYRDGLLLERHHQFTGQFCEVFDAEALALLQGTFRGIHLATQLNARLITVFSDNQAVLQSLRSMTATSSTQVFAVMSLAVQQYLDSNPAVRMAFRWVRGHSDVAGNEEADLEAKLGAEKGIFRAGATAPLMVSFASAARLSRERLQTSWQERWGQQREKAMRSGEPLPVYL
ncbi:hypothetical protein A4X13_0g1519, partial [Tilletia indica]